MKKLILIMSILGLVSCKDKVSQTEYVTNKDTIFVEDNSKIDSLQIEINLLRDSLSVVRDSLSAVKDNLGEDLFVANYKLGRIKYYNNIAAKGNNIKYLRGWINRVLNE